MHADVYQFLWTIIHSTVQKEQGRKTFFVPILSVKSKI